jgi:hypothetical protein
MPKSDEVKRRELLAEFLYWLFDSFVIPLLRAHFYITESGIDRNRIFYFRHDVWKRLSEPALDKLKLNMFQELKQPAAERMLAQRKLGFSTVRLLPKESGVRPIMNLKKRGMIVVCLDQTGGAETEELTAFHPEKRKNKVDTEYQLGHDPSIQSPSV